MLPLNQQHEVWRAAYCAALTGLITLGKYNKSHDTTCTEIADKALADFEKRWTPPQSQSQSMGMRGA